MRKEVLLKVSFMVKQNRRKGWFIYSNTYVYAMRKGFREEERYEGRKLWLWEKPLAYIDMLQEMKQEQEVKRV